MVEKGGMYWGMNSKRHTHTQHLQTTYPLDDGLVSTQGKILTGVKRGLDTPLSTAVQCKDEEEDSV